jgi:hypothetical protein
MYIRDQLLQEEVGWTEKEKLIQLTKPQPIFWESPEAKESPRFLDLALFNDGVLAFSVRTWL